MSNPQKQNQKNDITLEEKILFTGLGVIVIVSLIWLMELIKYNPAIM